MQSVCIKIFAENCFGGDVINIISIGGFVLLALGYPPEAAENMSTLVEPRTISIVGFTDYVCMYRQSMHLRELILHAF